MEAVRVDNPPNPYLTEHREILGEPPVADLEIYEDSSQQILSHNDSPDIGFSWSLNPYRGCWHACSYCYSRRTHEYFGLGAGTDFDRKIFVKRNAPELLEEAFEKKSWKGERIVFSGVTDCYQPLEAAWEITRRCLEICLKYQNAVTIITKSALVRRDAELLAELHRRAGASVCISAAFLDEEIARLIEPGTPKIAKRFETMKILADAGVPVGLAAAPIIPGLNDRMIPGLLKRAKQNGASFAFYSLLRLPGNVREVFLSRVRRDLPLKAEHIEKRIRDVRGGKLNDSRFGHRYEGHGSYWETIQQSWALWEERLGFNRGQSEDSSNRFCRPKKPNSQAEFSWDLI